MTHSIEVAQSILSTPEANEIIFSKLIENDNAGDGSLEESFETVILGTQVYSKAFTGILTPLVNGGSDDEGIVTDDTMTTTEKDQGHNAASSVADGFCLRSELPATELEFIPLGDRFDTVMKALNIDGDLTAYAACNYSAKRPEELSFIQFEEFRHIRKVSRGWYYGEKMKTPDREAKQSGLLERNKIIPRFELTVPLRVRTSRGSSRDTEKLWNIYYDKDDVVEINVSTLVET
jgi:hypothetical protein